VKLDPRPLLFILLGAAIGRLLGSDPRVPLPGWFSYEPRGLIGAAVGALIPAGVLMLPDPRLRRLLLAIVVGAAIGLVVGYAQRPLFFHRVDLIDWVGLAPGVAFAWLVFGALIFGGLWTLFRSKV